MSITNRISLVSLLILGVACGVKPQTGAVRQSLRNYSVNLKEMAANQVYLNDTIDGISAAGSADAAVANADAGVLAAQEKLTAAKDALAAAKLTTVDAITAAADALAAAKLSKKAAADLAKAAKLDATLQADATAADVLAQADAAKLALAVKAEADAKLAEAAALNTELLAEKAAADANAGVVGAQDPAADGLAQAQLDLKAAQDAAALADAAALEAKKLADAAALDANKLAKAAKADATLQADADAAKLLADAEALKAAAAADAAALAAADLAKAEAALVAAGGVVDPKAPSTDAVLDEVVKPRRIGQMVALLFATLDVDLNDVLSLNEFLKITDVKKIAAAAGVLNADQLAALQVKLTAQFALFAGADNAMTDVELAAFLKAQKSSVAKCRKQKAGQGQAQGAVARALSAELLLAKFDVNGDKVIDLTELAALQAALAVDAPAAVVAPAPVAPAAPAPAAPAARSGR